jgi:hypothetical protein
MLETFHADVLMAKIGLYSSPALLIFTVISLLDNKKLFLFEKILIILNVCLKDVFCWRNLQYFWVTEKNLTRLHIYEWNICIIGGSGSCTINLEYKTIMTMYIYCDIFVCMNAIFHTHHKTRTKSNMNRDKLSSLSKQT